ncbi:MAG: iron-sulfur cluster assembly scaffold protein [Candidatus Lokiarchaeota archaeon]|nr:iron-sulfur cluster assembly scaffold protein [Candidatus Lokiarchaeota archaeon]MBD3198796.1 iron-sulfur cluster assembly scaffold protein [Candidatus Lokiarchaeota archaeon]
MKKDSFDKFVDELQEEIIKQELEEFNETIVNLFHNPKNWGKLEDSDISVEHSYLGPCGDTMRFFLNINRDGIIEKANFITDGCGASVATGSQTTMMIQGKTIEDAKKLTPEEIDNALDGLPDDHKHCAELAVRTLRQAIQKYKKH